MTPVVLVIAVPVMYVVIAAAVAVFLVITGIWKHSTGMYRAGLVTAPPLMAGVIAFGAVERSWLFTSFAIATSISLVLLIVNFEVHCRRTRRLRIDIASKAVLS